MPLILVILALFSTFSFAPAHAATFTISPPGGSPPPTPIVSVSPDPTETSSVVTVTITDGPGNRFDYVAFAISTNFGNDQYIDYLYLNGMKTPPAVGVTATTLIFTMPAAPNTYQFRLLLNDTYTILAVDNVVVSAPPSAPQPQILASPNPVASAGTATITVANAPGNCRDWIGYAISTNFGQDQYIDYQYLNGSKSPPTSSCPTGATLTYTMPSTANTYQHRLFVNDTYTILASVNQAVSAPVAVLAIQTTTLPSGPIDTAYSTTVTAINGTTPYTWSATGLPTGLTINSGSGVISGTPTVSGAFTPEITVTDNVAAEDSRTYSLNIGSASGPANLFVAKNGNDSNPGTEASPFLTIQRGLNAAVTPGDVLQIGAGTYNERITVMASGTASNRITIQGSGTVIVDGGTLVTDWALVGGSCSGLYSKSFSSLGFTPGFGSWDDKTITWLPTGTMNSQGTTRLCMANTDANWNGLTALGGSYGLTGTAYVRYRDGRDPNVNNVRVSAYNGATITLTNKSYITIRGLTVKNGFNTIAISGGGNNIVESSDIKQFVNGVKTFTGTTLNTIQNNTILQNYIWTDYGHAWARSTADDVAGRINRVDADFYGIGVFQDGAGAGNIVQNNTLGGAVAGMWISGTDGSGNLNINTTVASNAFTLCSDFCFLAGNAVSVANLHVRDNTFHEYNNGMRWGSIYHGPIYVYRNKYSSTDAASSQNDITFSMFNVTPPASGVFFYHNSHSSKTSAISQWDHMANTYWINNAYSSASFYCACGQPLDNSFATQFDYNWIGGDGGGTVYAWQGSHNTRSEDTRLWGTGSFPAFDVPVGSALRNKGIDISTTWLGKSALPGFAPGYFGAESAPTAGAVQYVP